MAIALIVAASARGSSSSPRPAPAPAPSSSSSSSKAAAAPAPAPKNVPVSWGFPHAPRPRLNVAPGDTVTFSWDQLHGVYSLGKVAGRGNELKCDDFKNFHDAKGFLTVEPRREGYYGPQHGSVSWTAPEEEGVYAFADPIEQNCWAGMLLVVDVEKPKAAVVVAAAAPAPAPSKGGKKSNDDKNKKPAAAAVVVPAAAPAPAAAGAAVAVASVEKTPEPVSPSQQAAAVEGASFLEEEAPEAEMTPRERHAARVAEREAAREQRQTQRAVEEGRVDFEGAGQHVIED